MRKKKRKKKVITTNFYGNYKVLSPDGVLMFRASRKKISWYLDKELAEVIDDSTIQLKFEPNGLGYANDEFYLSDRENKCVVCGGTEKLTRHHIVSRCYRKYLWSTKKYSSHDIVLLCDPCHILYEKEANKVKNALVKIFGIPISGKGWEYSYQKHQVRMHASALLRFRDKIPQERQIVLLNTIRKHFKKQEITEEDIIKASQVKAYTKTPDFIAHGEYVLANIGDHQAFVESWRQHFLDCMKPKYMPPHWNVKRSIWK